MNVNKYDLHQLGWSSFQQLCVAVTTTVLGQTVESFLDGTDGGRDGAFQGRWSPQPGEILSGKYVIQCKFTSRREHNLTLSDVTDELAKARKLVQKGHCDIYVLMTNAGGTGASHLKIVEAFQAVGVRDVLIFDSTWICQKIEFYSTLRMNVPRLYGLGDLSQILDERRYKQTKALLSELKPDLAKTVVTNTYRNALRALNTHGFVLLVGEPAAGKTTIASLLAMCAMDEWKSHVLKLETPEQVRAYWNTEEPSQFIWVDDAFGVTQYESHLVMSWNRTLDAVATMIKRGHRVVMTSRDYIYNQAKRDLKKTSFPLFEESQVVIDVKRLSLQEKEQILYNHLKLGDQSKAVLTKLKPLLPDVASSSRFVPEAARRLGNSKFTKGLVFSKSGIEEFIVKQEQILVDTLRSMDEDSRAALALIYMKEGAVESPVSLSTEEERAISRLGSSEAKCLRAMEDLNGSFVQLVDTEVSRIWRYKHPTIGDAFALILAQSPEHLKIFVDGTSIERLMDLVSCGNVGVEKATVIPPVMFGEIAQRVYRYISSDVVPTEAYLKRGRFYSFLSNRCNREFLVKYLQVDIELSHRVVKGFSTSWFSSPTSLALRLRQEGLMSEDDRLKIVSTMLQEVMDGEDLAPIYDRKLQKFFNPGELDAFLVDVQEYVLPNLDAVRDDWISRYDYDNDPDSHVADLIDQLESILHTHPDWADIELIIHTQRKRIDNWVAEISGERGSEPLVSRENLMPNFKNRNVRSIFDDVDV